VLEDAGLKEDELVAGPSPKGKDDADPLDEVLQRLPERERPFVEILLRSQRARAESTMALFGIVRRAAQGGAHWEPNPNYEPGNPEQPKYVQTGFTPSDWKAAKHLQAIRNPEYSERFRQEISGPGGAPMQVAGVVIELPPEDDGPGEETSE
jgi:hypothetical protein